MERTNFLAFFVFSATLTLTCIEGQILMPCHSNIFQFTSRHSLNISQYMGEWYMHEIASSNIGNFPPPDYKCAKRNLRLNGSRDPQSLFAVDSYITIEDGSPYNRNLQIQTNDSRSPLNSLWKTTEETETGSQTSDVVILFADLDFQEWTVVYSCSILPPFLFRYEVLIAMARTPQISQSTRRTLKALMVGQGFRIGDHHPIDQTGC